MFGIMTSHKLCFFPSLREENFCFI